MALCPACGKDWPAHVGRCPIDGAMLSAAGDDRQKVSSEPTLLSGAGLAAAPAVKWQSGAEIQPGTTIGDYRVEGKLGSGGMGEVFAAIHPLIGKKAAVKIINRELCTNPAMVERFVQEARAVNQIAHPNIVDVFAFGALPDGRSYFVMERLEGESLAARLKRGRLTFDEIAEILDAVCRALGAAHNKGIVHRDLKPDNIFLVAVRGERPLIKLLDFGIAKLELAEWERLSQTRTGAMLGTPLYISPEQARGRPVDHRTDLYALGAVTYEMITGRPPFTADNTMDLVAMHLHDTPAFLHDLRPDVPPRLERLVLEMLDKDPAVRPSLEEMRAVLTEVRGTKLAQIADALVERERRRQTETPALPPPVQRRTSRGAEVGGVLAVAAVLAVAIVAWREGRPAKVAPTPAPVQVAPPAPPPAPPPRGSLRVRLPAGTDDARVAVDGQVAPAGERIELTPGGHEVTVSATGHEPFRTTVQLTAGETLELPVALQLTPPPRPARNRSGHEEAAKPAPTVPAPPAPIRQAPGDDDDAPINPFPK